MKCWLMSRLNHITRTTTGIQYCPYTVQCHYNLIQYAMIFHTSLKWLRQSINHSLNPQNTSHRSPCWASNGMYFVRTWEKIHHIRMAPHCISSSKPMEFWSFGNAHSLLMHFNQILVFSFAVFAHWVEYMLLQEPLLLTEINRDLLMDK